MALFTAIISSFSGIFNGYICLFERLCGIYFIWTSGGASIITTIDECFNGFNFDRWFAPSAIFSATTIEAIGIDLGSLVLQCSLAPLDENMFNQFEPVAEFVISFQSIMKLTVLTVIKSYNNISDESPLDAVTSSSTLKLNLDSNSARKRRTFILPIADSRLELIQDEDNVFIN